jgi:hypothetical protein
MVASMKMTAYWDIELCSLVQVDQRFRGAYCDALMMEAVHTSETSVNFYKNTQRNNPEGCHLHHNVLSF